MSDNRDNDQIKIVGICGSLRTISYTRMTVQLALKGAKAVNSNVVTELIDLRDYNLPFCNPNDNAFYEDEDRLIKKVTEAHGIILGSPEYHGSFSGVLKNALDLMGFNEFEGKIVGLVGVGGGSVGAINALNAMRIVCRWVRAWVIPHQASVARPKNVFTDDGKILDPALEERILKVGRDVARYAYLHFSEKTTKLLNEWEQRPTL